MRMPTSDHGDVDGGKVPPLERLDGGAGWKDGNRGARRPGKRGNTLRDNRFVRSEPSRAPGSRGCGPGSAEPSADPGRSRLPGWSELRRRAVDHAEPAFAPRIRRPT